MSFEECIRNTPVQSSGFYRAWQVGGSAAAAIDLAWHSRSDYGRPEAHRLLPFTEPSLALRRHFSKAGETLDWDFVILRAQPDGGAYVPPEGEELYALRLAPELMEVAIDLKATDHTREDCAPPGFLMRRLEGAARLADCGQFGAAWTAMYRIVSQEAEGLHVDRVSQAVHIARHSKGAIGPGSIAEKAGLSARHMRRSFMERLGLTPRAIQRRARLTATMLEAEQFARPSWAALAAGQGFSDQAHMIREFRSLTGITPGQWHTMRRDVAVSFNT